VREFKDAAFNAEAGTVVGPVKTSFGYHIIKVVSKEIGKPMEYHEVELRVRNEMRQELIQEYITKLKTQAKVTIDHAALDKM
jgi:parvulin-like peptidyl-prolyl isomerase